MTRGISSPPALNVFCRVCIQSCRQNNGELKDQDFPFHRLLSIASRKWSRAAGKAAARMSLTAEKNLSLNAARRRRLIHALKTARLEQTAIQSCSTASRGRLDVDGAWTKADWAVVRAHRLRIRGKR